MEQVFTHSKDMKKIVTKFGKLRHNCLPMGIQMPLDTFQYKVNKLLSDIEGVKVYINNIIVFSKDILLSIYIDNSYIL